MSSIVFFGNERLATGVSTTAPTLTRLLEAGYEVVAVVSNYSEGVSRKQRTLEIAEVASTHGIPVLLPDKPADILDELGGFGADIGVLVAYGKIVPQSVIDLFPRGIVNIHPSLLPLHRGPTPLESVILDGSAESGVSIMQLVKAMDAGGVYGQVVRPLTGTETKQELADDMLALGGGLLLDLLPNILDGSLPPIPQDERRATYDNKIDKADGVLDFSKPAVQLGREVRAYAGWPGSRATLSGRDIVVTGAHVLTATDGVDLPAGNPGDVWRSGKQFGFHTSEGVLVIDRLKPAGKQEMTAESFLAGYKI